MILTKENKTMSSDDIYYANKDIDFLYDKMKWLHFKIEEMYEGNIPDESDIEIMLEFSQYILDDFEDSYIRMKLQGKKWQSTI